MFIFHIFFLIFYFHLCNGSPDIQALSLGFLLRLQAYFHISYWLLYHFLLSKVIWFDFLTQISCSFNYKLDYNGHFDDISWKCGILTQAWEQHHQTLTSIFLSSGSSCWNAAANTRIVYISNPFCVKAYRRLCPALTLRASALYEYCDSKDGVPGQRWEWGVKLTMYCYLLVKKAL